MKSTEISYHQKFGDVLGREGITNEQITEPNVCLVKMISISVS